MDIKHVYDIEALRALLRKSIEKFGDKKRFLHPKTIENFLFYFDSLKDKRKKEHVYNNIKEYLNIVSLLEYEELDSIQSIQLFDNFIYPITNYFSIYIGFTVHVKWYLFVIIAVTLFVVSILVDVKVYYKIGVFLILTGICFFKLKKEQSQKTYGVYY